MQGVYFPLQRFGEFWVSARDADGEAAYLMFESAKDWTRAQAKLRAAGFTITATGRKDQNYQAKVGEHVVKITDFNPKNHHIFDVGDKAFVQFTRDDVHVL